VSHDLFIVTYAPDARWLQFCLRSIVKYARGFRRTLVLFPAAELMDFSNLIEEFKNFPIIFKSFNERPGQGHMHHNIVKCRADLYTDADFITHIDSDCVLMGVLRPEDLLTNGKADVIYTKFSDCQSPWQAVTENALRCRVDVETMRRHPFTYPRFLYGALRAHIEHVQGKAFDDYVFTAPGVGGAHRGFTEFCTLGAYAKYFHPDQFHFYDTTVGVKPNVVRQYWSYSRLNDSERSQLEAYTQSWREKQIHDH
jgi:hypothetical protein